LYLAEPGDDKSNPFGIDNIRRCYAPISNSTPIAFGIDLAKYTDWTVITGLDKDNNVCYLDRFQSDWEQTQRKIVNVVGRIPAFVDSTGVGDPIVENLQRLLPNIKGFRFTSQSKQQIIEGLVMEIQQNSIAFPESPIGYELENIEYEYTRTGVKYAAPSGLHDDCVMSLALAVDCKKHNKKGIFAFA
jgi:hypothetical protein